jgi:hypothetical protein
MGYDYYIYKVIIYVIDSKEYVFEGENVDCGHYKEIMKHDVEYDSDDDVETQFLKTVDKTNKYIEEYMNKNPDKILYEDGKWSKPTYEKNYKERLMRFCYERDVEYEKIQRIINRKVFDDKWKNRRINQKLIDI